MRNDRHWLAWFPTSICFALIGTWLVFRLQSGLLFLVPLPWDAPASTIEITDAAARSKNFIWGPSAAMICFFGLAVGTPLAAPVPFTRGIPGHLQSALRTYPWLGITALVAGLFDFVTTFLFFQRSEMHLEMHAGVVLTAYAFGRTTGLIAAKVVQLGGLFLLASYLPRYPARFLLKVGAVLCLWAARENVQHLAGGERRTIRSQLTMP